MKNLRFTWDDKKNRLNRKKHGIPFEEAQTAFYDENARLMADPDHSEEEERFILLGLSAKLRVLVVCHCYREKQSLIRIISARKGNKKEKKNIWGIYHEEKLRLLKFKKESIRQKAKETDYYSPRSRDD